MGAFEPQSEEYKTHLDIVERAVTTICEVSFFYTWNELESNPVALSKMFGDLKTDATQRGVWEKVHRLSSGRWSSGSSRRR